MMGAPCGGCLRAYTQESWSSLRLVRTITRGELEHIVVGWHQDRFIEVRACEVCGRELARSSRAA
jgi:hypothetical protein